ncbi:MAG: hypothetical protein K9K82_04565 [Desulfobacteraceae bacterium]|nr:hypothetical protein [Desulfobacteraceae bacterium]
MMKQPGNRHRIKKIGLISAAILLLLSFAGSAQETALTQWEKRNDLLHLPAFRSVNATSSLLLDITKAGARLVTVGEKGTILYSDDKGENWTQADVPVRVTLTAVDFANAQAGWAVGHDGVVLHTEDGGKTWKLQMEGREGGRLNVEYARQRVADKKAELAGSEANARADIQNELKEARAALDFWEAESKRWGNPLLDVWFKNSREGFVIGSYGRFYHTNNGGKNWVPAWDRIANPHNWHLNAFAVTTETIFIAGESGTLYRSRDGGKSWESLKTPYEGSYLGIVASDEHHFVIAYGIGAKMVLSNDGGDTWNLMQTKAGAALSGGTVKNDGSVLIISYSGVLLTGPGISGELTPGKIGSGWEAVTQTDDGHIILVGLKGVLRTAL